MDSDNVDLRIGTVMVIDAENRKVRVKFKDTGLQSGWLTVIQRYNEKVYIEPAGSHDHESDEAIVKDIQTKTHTEFDKEGNAVAAGTSTNHNHLATVTCWMPQVNDTVLAIYLPAFNADGFVLGGIY